MICGVSLRTVLSRIGKDWVDAGSGIAKHARRACFIDVLGLFGFRCETKCVSF